MGTGEVPQMVAQREFDRGTAGGDSFYHGNAFRDAAPPRRWNREEDGAEAAAGAASTFSVWQPGAYRHGASSSTAGQYEGSVPSLVRLAVRTLSIRGMGVHDGKTIKKRRGLRRRGRPRTGRVGTHPYVASPRPCGALRFTPSASLQEWMTWQLEPRGLHPPWQDSWIFRIRTMTSRNRRCPWCKREPAGDPRSACPVR